MAAQFKYYVLVVCYVLLSSANLSDAWEVDYGLNSTSITVHMNTMQTINVTLIGFSGTKYINANVSLVSGDEILKTSKQIVADDIFDDKWTGEFNISAEFLGMTTVHVEVSLDGQIERSNRTLSVVIIREERTVDRIFTVSVVALVAILYINFGAALDLGKVKEILVRPIGPLIAFVCQFLFMPLVIFDEMDYIFHSKHF